MARISRFILAALLCLVSSAGRADPVNEPGVPTPVDTTPMWLRQMSTPPIYINPEQPAAATEPAAATTAVPAQPYVPYTLPNYVEAGVDYYNVTNGVGNTFGQFVNLQYQVDPWNRLNAGIQHAQAYNDSGEAVYVGDTHTFDEDWYGDFGAGMASSASFLTRYRVDAALDRKWLEGRNLITIIGYTWDEADKTYTDNTLHLAAAYYFTTPWVIQGGVNINDSNPGNVIAPSAFGALTYGSQKAYFLTGKFTIAREAYELLNTGNITTSFTSYTYDLNWREWVGEDWGFNLGSEYYTNPFYNRVGGLVSVFKEF